MDDREHMLFTCGGSAPLGYLTVGKAVKTRAGRGRENWILMARTLGNGQVHVFTLYLFPGFRMGALDPM